MRKKEKKGEFLGLNDGNQRGKTWVRWALGHSMLVTITKSLEGNVGGRSPQGASAEFSSREEARDASREQEIFPCPENWRAENPENQNPGKPCS